MVRNGEHARANVRLIRVAAGLLAWAALTDCSHSTVSAPLTTGACGTTALEPSYGCAIISATVLSSPSQPAFAFVVLANLSDTTRYSLTGALTDNTGHVFIEVRRRQAAGKDTASIDLLAQTPPSSLGTFRCVRRLVPIRFASIGIVPDTLPFTWTLPAETVARTTDCGG
jgi:hypothetical protein